MDEIYTGHGLKFEYPNDWEFSESKDDDSISIQIESEATAFWSMTILFNRRESQQAIESALDVFREEYDELDIYSLQIQLCDRDTIAYDLEFVCLDVINYAALRQFDTDRHTVFVLYQGAEIESAQYRSTLDRISESLVCSDD